MKLSSILSKQLICLDLSAHEKEEALGEMASFAAHRTKSLTKEQLLSAIKEREDQQSTYMGHHLLMPHARVDGLQDFVVVCGRSLQGITIPESEEKVHFIVLLLSCKTKATMLLQTMGAFAQLFSNDQNYTALLQSKSEDDIIKIVTTSGVVIKQTLCARDIMNPDVVTITIDQTLADIISLLFEHNVSGVPVIDHEKKVLGVITESDIIKIGIPKYMSLMNNVSFLSDFEPFEEIFKKEDVIRVQDMYSKDFIFVHEEVSVIQLAFLFVTKKCRRIVVLDDQKHLVGIIMRKDLIRKVINA